MPGTIVQTAKTTPLTMPNLSQGRAPPTAVILEPKNSEPGSTSEKGESYDRHVRRARQKQKHNNRRSGGGSRWDYLPLRGGLFVRNILRRHIHPSFHRGRLSWRPPDMPPKQTRTSSAKRRRALELLAGSPDGMTEAILLAHGFTVDMLADLIRAG